MILRTDPFMGYYESAMVECANAIRLDPSEFGAYVDMARSLSALGRPQEAIYYFSQSLIISPWVPQTHYYFGLESLKVGQMDRAISEFREATRLAPTWPNARVQLAVSLATQGAMRDAVLEYQNALRFQPDSLIALNNLAWILATYRDETLRCGKEAVRLATRPCELTSWKQTIVIGTLAAAYAEAGDFDKAVAASEKACELAVALGETNLLALNRDLLRQFKNREPCRAN